MTGYNEEILVATCTFFYCAPDSWSEQYYALLMCLSFSNFIGMVSVMCRCVLSRLEVPLTFDLDTVTSDMCKMLR